MLEHELSIDRRGFLAGLAVASALAAVSPIACARLRKDNAMDIQRVGSQASVKGPEEWFTGSVRIDPLLSTKDPSQVGAASVTFEPGARTAWHTHPLGQHLIITAGVGWVQQEGEPIQDVRPGDVVWFPPGVKHWHGATPENAMTHIAIQEAHNGSPVDWLEHVSDAQYRK
jgi:quercetin dioxygenase-like cupin family protein